MLVAITLTLVMVFTLTADLAIAESDVAIPAPVVFGPEPMPFGWECLCGKKECNWCGWGDDCTCITCDADAWLEFHADAVAEYAAEFDALFAMVEFKVAKNGRGMIRTGDSGPYKFVKKG